MKKIKYNINNPDYNKRTRLARGSNYNLFSFSNNDKSKFDVIIEILTGISVHNIFLISKEVDIYTKISSDNIVRFIEFEIQESDRQVKIVYEKAKGRLFSEHLINMPFSIGDCIRNALELFSGLSEIHAAGLAHKALHPANITLRSSRPFAIISGFDFGRRFSPGNLNSYSSRLWGDFLPYMSPEHIGRGHRLDHLSDFYCAGAMMYECLTGKTPFEKLDRQKVTHAHFALTPLPPHLVNGDIPLPLSDIVMRLLAKVPGERYQTCRGILADLERCLNRWVAKGTIAPFALGRKDIPSALVFSGRLYGREKEARVLSHVMGRVISGSKELMLVAGHAGIGKSALVRESLAKAKMGNGYFISGKFDQYQEDIPYSGFAQSLRDLVQRILTAPREELESLRKDICTALGVNMRLITELVPEAEKLLGPQPPVPTLGPVETVNRFKKTVMDFFKVMCRPGRCLVLFLDDLHWADQRSLDILENIMEEDSLGGLFLVGAYRDDEIGPYHPLVKAIERLEGKSLPVWRLSLGPLQEKDVAALLSETLRLTPRTAAPLSMHLERKTGGNPFFLLEILRALHEKELLVFRASTGSWAWDLSGIKQWNISEDIVKFLSGRMLKLSPEAREAINMAAFLGSSFNLGSLSLLLEKPASRVSECLQELVGSGALFHLNKTEGRYSAGRAFNVEFMFSHDRVRQTAYAATPESEIPARHLIIGRKLLAGLPDKMKEAKTEDITAHLNHGASLIVNNEEKANLARMNLQAGRNARNKAAFSLCHSFLSAGIRMLSPGMWKKDYNLALSLHLETAEAAYLNGDYAFMRRLAKKVLVNARDLADKAKIYKILIQAEFARNNLRLAKKIGLHALGLLGVSLPEAPEDSMVATELLRIRELLCRFGPENLASQPAMKDPVALAAMELLQMTLPAALFTEPALLALIICEIVELSIRHGNTEGSVVGYGFFASILVSPFADIEGAHRLAKASLDVEKAFASYWCDGIAAFLYGHYVRHWKEHPAPWTDVVKSFVPKMVERGNYEYAGHYLSSPVIYEFFIGRNLAHLEKELAGYISLLKSLNQETSLLNNLFEFQAIHNLLGNAENPVLLRGDCADLESMIAASDARLHVNALFLAYLFKTILCFLFGSYREAVRCSAETENNTIGATRALFHTAVHAFFDSLSRLAVFEESGDQERGEILKKVTANQEKMGFWATQAPMNFLHKFHLVEAEKCRVLGRDREAMEHYDQAVTGAVKNDYTNEEALANELAARFYFARDRKSLARAYISAAREAYIRWGASAKVAHLEGEWIGLLAPGPSTPKTEGGDAPAPEEDLGSVIHAAHLITKERDVGGLLAKLMDLVMVSAGAARGFLVLDKAEGLFVQDRISAQKTGDTFTPVPLRKCRALPHGIIRYAARTGEILLLENASAEGLFTSDPYVRKNGTRSVLCLPLLDKGEQVGVLYLENTLLAGAFSPERVGILKAVADILSSTHARNLAESELLERQRRLQDLSTQLSLAEERERRHIAGQLHERIGHGLAETAIKLGSLLARSGLSSKDRALAEEARAIVDRTMEDTRGLIFEISPPILYDLGLSAALEWLGEETNRRNAIRVSFEDRSGDIFITENLRVFLFQAARELIFNAVKHADSSRVAIILVHEGERLLLSVNDDGKGFHPKMLKEKRGGKGGFGLFGIRERASRMGGQLEVSSFPGKGTRVTLVMPLVGHEHKNSGLS
ncbi:MAG: AAA family ATPase [Thermodesulfobacteriota bacterium]